MYIDGIMLDPLVAIGTGVGVAHAGGLSQIAHPAGGRISQT
jgi:hypothetical protein